MYGRRSWVAVTVTIVAPFQPVFGDTHSDLVRLGEKLGVDLVAAKRGWDAIRASHERVAGDVLFTVCSRTTTRRTTSLLSFVIDGRRATLIEQSRGREPEIANAVVCTGRKSFVLQKKGDKWILLFATNSPTYADDAISVRLSFVRMASWFLAEPVERFLLRGGFSKLVSRDEVSNDMSSVRIDLEWKGRHPVGGRPCKVHGFLVLVPEWNWMIVRSQKTIEITGQQPVCVEHVFECDPKAATKDVFMVKTLRTRWIWGNDATSRMNQNGRPDKTQIFEFVRLNRIGKGEVTTSLRQFGIPDLDYGMRVDPAERDVNKSPQPSVTHPLQQRDSFRPTMTRFHIAIGTIALATVMAFVARWRCRRGSVANG